MDEGRSVIEIGLTEVETLREAPSVVFTGTLPGQICGGATSVHSPSKTASLVTGPILVEPTTVPVAEVLASSRTPVPSDTYAHNTETVTFAAAGVPVVLQTRAPFKVSGYNVMATVGAAAAMSATHINMKKLAEEKEAIVLYYIFI